MDKQNKVYLYIAILIPVLMIVITSLSVLFYKVDLHPKYNFIYMIKNGNNAYQCWKKIKDDIFSIKSANANQTVNCSSAKLYEYDFASQQSKLVTLDQVKKMKLSQSSEASSPDGFTINSYCYSSDISGWGKYNKSYYSVCIKKGDLKQKLNINYSKDYPEDFYYFFFIGWILHSDVSTP